MLVPRPHTRPYTLGVQGALLERISISPTTLHGGVRAVCCHASPVSAEVHHSRPAGARRTRLELLRRKSLPCDPVAASVVSLFAAGRLPIPRVELRKASNWSRNASRSIRSASRSDTAACKAYTSSTSMIRQGKLQSVWIVLGSAMPRRLSDPTQQADESRRLRRVETPF